MLKNLKYVPKGWGYEIWIANSEDYCGKLLHFEKDKRCSWHYHKLKDETFFIPNKGRIEVLYSLEDDIDFAKSIMLKVGDAFHVPVGMRHQIIAHQETDLIEFSTEHFDSDSYRLIKGD